MRRLVKSSRLISPPLLLFSLKKGLAAVVPLDMLKVFDERELELLIGGLSQIDVNDWRHHTVYQDGYSPTSPVGGE
jgi:hypothetical protein